MSSHGLQPRHLSRIFFIACCFIFLFIPGVYCIDGLPNYRLTYLGNGSPAAINNSGVVVGSRMKDINSYEPLVSVGGSPWNLLPVPDGADSVLPMDINDHGVIVGVSFNTEMNPLSVIWFPSENGYVVEYLPLLPGNTSSYATGINNVGQIVGARGSLGYVPVGPGWLYHEQTGMTDLQTIYGLWTSPTEINDAGQIISGGIMLNIDTGIIKELTGQPANYYGVTAIDINNSGFIAGEAPMRSTSLNIRSVFLYGGAVWQYLAGTSKYTVASSINNLGDVGYGELGAGLYLEGLGTFAVWELLDPQVVEEGWTVTGSYPKINDMRSIAVAGKNMISGLTGAVLLTQSGYLAAPPAPTNLQGTAHYADRSQPWNSIDLTWTNTSPLTKGYVLERRVSSSGEWTQLALTPPGTSTSFSDITVEVGKTYDYRILATGLAGESPWSAIATVTAPLIPVDVVPPDVHILSPSQGEMVSGILDVVAEASDDTGVKYLELSYWDQYVGQQIGLGNITDSNRIVAVWDTNKMIPGEYTLTAYAHDALGNWNQSNMTVQVVSVAKTMSISNILLKSQAKSGRVTIMGNIIVKDNVGRAVENASVSIVWKLPGGGNVLSSSMTDSAGRAGFMITGGRGTYTLTVNAVQKSGLIFDAEGSILSKSITK